LGRIYRNMKHICEFEEFEGHPINEGVIGDIWERFKKMIADLFSKKTPEAVTDKTTAPSKPPLPITGQHMLYLPHQQGPEGASRLVKIVKGEMKMDTATRNKLLNNMPSNIPEFEKVKTGPDQEAALAFLNYQKNTWDQYTKEAIAQINQPQFKRIKDAIDRIPESKFPKDFLYTVAYKESRLDPNPKRNRAYRGLFQIGDMAWQQLKKLDPKIYKGSIAPLDPKKNAQAGHDYLAWSYDLFEKKVKGN
jgi:hypothetical protein